MANFPTSLDTLTNPTSTDPLSAPPHATQHTDANDILEAVETKLGTGASTPTTVGHVLTVTGAGATAYQAAGSTSFTVMQMLHHGLNAYVAANYYDGGLNGSAYQSGTITANRLYFMPFYCIATTTFDRIGINVVTGGAGGTLARLGIYNTNATTHHPGTLLLDAGTVAVDATAAVQVTISQSLTGDTLYWLALVSDGAPVITSRSLTDITNYGLSTLSTTNSSLNMIDRAFTFAALPDPAGTVSLFRTASVIPSIRLRAS